MKYKNRLKIQADTYFFGFSKTVLFITALFSVFVMYLVNAMTALPELALKYYFAVPVLLKNVLLVCAASAAAGAVFEIGTN